jgi:hypothetical protein
MSTPELILPLERVERARPYSPPAVQANDAATIMQIVERMMRESTFDPVAIREMLAIKKEYEADEARKAFTADMAEFKKNPPVIYKNKHVGFTSKRTGDSTSYDHATHSEVTLKIISGLAQHGFSHRWIPTQPNGQVCVTVVITHRLGHSESMDMTAPPDTSGNKSPVQAILSTKTLLERHLLLAATGLTAADMPDADDKEDKPTINPDVWTALGDASREGESELRKMWEKLSETTRDIIFEHYAEDWSALKNQAIAVDAKNKGVDVAHAMRRLMNQDLDEKIIAKQVAEENSRLNREAPELLNAAWQVLSSDERRAWKGWNDLGENHESQNR